MKPTKLKRRMEIAGTPRDRDAYTRAVDGLCRVSVGTPEHPFSRRSRPACDVSISIDETVGATWYGRVFYEFFTVAGRVLSVSLSDAPIVRWRICMINRRASRAGASVDQLNERWRMRP